MQTTEQLSALISSLQERDAVWKRERTQWPPGISDEAKQHHYAEIGKNVEPHLPSFLALSRWAMEAEEQLCIEHRTYVPNMNDNDEHRCAELGRLIDSFHTL